MANEILIIGVGSAGVIAADKMNLPNSKKLFVDTDYRQLDAVKSEGDNVYLSPIFLAPSSTATPIGLLSQ